MTSGRWDLYGPIHKGLRFAHAEMLKELGRADFATPDVTMEALRFHLALCAKHLAHEERYIHPALEARASGGAHEIERQHEEHREDFARLERAMATVERASQEGRAAAGRQLYLTFSSFVAADFLHMQEEETVFYPQLCALFSDAELMAMEMEIIHSLTPEENIAYLRLMVPAMNGAERRALLTGIKNAAPPAVFQAIVTQAVRPTLNAEDFAALQTLELAA
ncbi:MAG: hemerythrin domain-containing protein [Alphaproteobacteria bacterium]|nr:hemerythrin domain-containing protein [Alphaproteobacteria bacterium]